MAPRAPSRVVLNRRRAARPAWLCSRFLSSAAPRGELAPPVPFSQRFRLIRKNGGAIGPEACQTSRSALVGVFMPRQLTQKLGGAGPGAGARLLHFPIFPERACIFGKVTWLHHKVGTRPDFGRVSRGASAASGRPTSHAGGPADPVGTRPVLRWARGDPRPPMRLGVMTCNAATRAAGPPTNECAECGHPHLSRSRHRRTSGWADQSSTLRHLQAAWQDSCI